jgi:hypothetical protein
MLHAAGEVDWPRLLPEPAPAVGLGLALGLGLGLGVGGAADADVALRTVVAATQASTSAGMARRRRVPVAALSRIVAFRVCHIVTPLAFAPMPENRNRTTLSGKAPNTTIESSCLDVKMSRRVCPVDMLMIKTIVKSVN